MDLVLKPEIELVAANDASSGFALGAPGIALPCAAGPGDDDEDDDDPATGGSGGNIDPDDDDCADEEEEDAEDPLWALWGHRFPGAVFAALQHTML